MKIVADSGILGLAGSAQHLAECCDFVFESGRSLAPAQLHDAEALLVRSITPVNAGLLEGSAVGFVGSATSGLDHIDSDYLDATGVHFAHAKGANAAAVVDYVFGVLALLSKETGREIFGTTVGVVGRGCVGGLLDQTLQQAGFSTRCCDAPLAALESGATTLVSLDDALACPIVCLHVPLSSVGSFPTRNLIGSVELKKMASSAVLINPSRGGVVNEAALKEHLSRSPNFIYAADVWMDEPRADPELVEASWLATPHIAGYSVQAKQLATSMLLTALSQYCASRKKIDIAQALNCAAEDCRIEGGQIQEVALDPATDLSGRAVWAAVTRLLDLRAIDKKFRGALADGITAESFDAQRKPLLKRQQLSLARLRTYGLMLNESERRLADALQITLLE